jgi:GNAT superfamily N-acetyltransferase
MRPARPEEAGRLAKMMMDLVTWGRLRHLGPWFNTLMHRAFIKSPHGLCMVLELDGEVIGYGAGFTDYRAFHRWMKLRYGWLMGLVLLPKLLHPRNLKTVLRAFTYFPDAPQDDPRSELVCMNVIPAHHGSGYATRIFHGLVDELRRRGVDCVKLGHIDPTQKNALGFWNSIGARHLRTEKFYSHNEVYVYVYDIV